MISGQVDGWVGKLGKRGVIEGILIENWDHSIKRKGGVQCQGCSVQACIEVK